MKRIIWFVILAVGIASAAPAADQFFFELNGGIYFYAGLGGKAGWIHYWKNEKIGFICDISYYNNGFVDKFEGDWKEAIKGINTAGQSPAPAASGGFPQQSCGVSNLIFPHSLDHAHAGHGRDSRSFRQ